MSLDQNNQLAPKVGGGLGGIPRRGAGVSGREIGDIVCAVNAPESGSWLECNGGVYAQADYSGLFAAVGHYGLHAPIPEREFSTKLANPATLPAGSAQDLDVYEDTENELYYIAIAHTTTPFITVYKMAFGNDTWTKLSNPATLPSGNGQGVSWNNDGTQLLVATGSSGNILEMYSRSGDTLTHHGSAPYDTISVTTSQCCKFSPDGTMAAAGGNGGDITDFWSHDGNGNLTRLASVNPSSARTDFLAWSPDSRFCVGAEFSGDYVSVYLKNASGDMAQITDPPTKPTNDQEHCSFSPDGKLFSTSGQATETVNIWSIDPITGAMVKKSTTAIAPTTTTTCCVWSPDGQWLFTNTATGELEELHWIDTEGSNVADMALEPFSITTGGMKNGFFTSNGQKLFVCNTNSPYIECAKYDELYTKATEFRVPNMRYRNEHDSKKFWIKSA